MARCMFNGYRPKGHEDIRQDERVMQLFGLVNTLLATDPECLKRHLNIQRYAAIPLSTQSGLLGWVPNSDTLHVLIREYRESRKILLNIEHRIMLQMAPDYDNLTLMQKVEVFGYALDNTTGQDLYRVLWLKSKSSEAWLDRRTNYTRSLAVMSMVGYILGLGDRHPSNLMLDRVTGKIIHIDFGDCFEVAMHREKYPERVPFRLTRMLTFAMEVSNIEGSFRTTCEHVMRLLRAHKESLMAVLEAFVHDPLLTWRLNTRDSPPEPSFPSERRTSIMGAAMPQEARRGSVMGAAIPQDARRGSIMGGDPNAPNERPGSSYRPRNRLSSAQANGNLDPVEKEVQNARALQVLSRVKEKLTGRDFKKQYELEVNEQVEKLLSEATNLENLCQHYIGVSLDIFMLRDRTMLTRLTVVFFLVRLCGCAIVLSLTAWRWGVCLCGITRLCRVAAIGGRSGSIGGLRLYQLEAEHGGGVQSLLDEHSVNRHDHCTYTLSKCSASSPDPSPRANHVTKSNRQARHLSQLLSHRSDRSPMPFEPPSSKLTMRRSCALAEYENDTTTGSRKQANVYMICLRPSTYFTAYRPISIEHTSRHAILAGV